MRRDGAKSAILAGLDLRLLDIKISFKFLPDEGI